MTCLAVHSVRLEFARGAELCDAFLILLELFAQLQDGRALVLSPLSPIKIRRADGARLARTLRLGRRHATHDSPVFSRGLAAAVPRADDRPAVVVRSRCRCSLCICHSRLVRRNPRVHVRLQHLQSRPLRSMVGHPFCGRREGTATCNTCLFRALAKHAGLRSDATHLRDRALLSGRQAAAPVARRRVAPPPALSAAPGASASRHDASSSRGVAAPAAPAAVPAPSLRQIQRARPARAARRGALR